MFLLEPPCIVELFGIRTPVFEVSSDGVYDFVGFAGNSSSDPNWKSIGCDLTGLVVWFQYTRELNVPCPT